MVVCKGLLSLTEMELGDHGQVLEINGGHGIARQLGTLGVRPGKVLRKVSNVFKHGPVVVELDGRMIAVGRGQARRIMVETK